MRVVRLTVGDRAEAMALFDLMANVFGEDSEEVTNAYVDGLLSRREFWAIAAIVDQQVIGGLTAHTLPLTRSASAEVFIYDVAVRQDYQRRGVGRQLLTTLRQEAASIGIVTSFVAADNDDEHALDFYCALGGAAAPVTMFTFTHAVHEESASRSPKSDF